VLGEHGDSEVLHWSGAAAGNLSVAEVARQMGRRLTEADRSRIIMSNGILSQRRQRRLSQLMSLKGRLSKSQNTMLQADHFMNSMDHLGRGLITLRRPKNN
jgi:hypothetical protein